jgi:5-methyltetrahydrofolate--homocysteine methyltransferase
LADLKELIVDLGDVDNVKRIVEDELKSDKNPTKIIDQVTEALTEVGKRYDRGEYFLSELMMAGIIASEVSKILEPYFADGKEKMPSKGKVIIGTVKGDIHDIGKNIVIMMLQATGYEVIDLGIDVSVEKFTEAVKQKKGKILGMSALLTSTMYEMGKVIEGLKKEGLRNDVKVILGGRPVTKDFANEIGADAYAEDSIEAIEVINGLIG